MTYQIGSPAVAGQKHGGEYAMGHVDVEAPTAAELKKAERKAARKAEKKAEKKVRFFTFFLFLKTEKIIIFDYRPARRTRTVKRTRRIRKTRKTRRIRRTRRERRTRSKYSSELQF